MARLIVSVKDRNEAMEALKAGATWLDVKDPGSGSLGRASTQELSEIVKMAGCQGCLVSAALGELSELEKVPENWPWSQLELVKVGLAGQLASPWAMRVDELAHEIKTLGSCLVIGVYADYKSAQSPPWLHCLDYAINRKMPAVLIDTFWKNGRRLPEIMGSGELERMAGMARANSIGLALAGSLDLATAKKLIPLNPAFFAARGAFCEGGDRNSGIVASRVREWLSLTQTP